MVAGWGTQGARWQTNIKRCFPPSYAFFKTSLFSKILVSIDLNNGYQCQISDKLKYQNFQCQIDCKFEKI